MKKIYKLHVFWGMSSVMFVEAESEEEAIETAYESPLPEDGEYVGESFDIDWVEETET